jgi:hypothetical protein
MNTSTNLQNQHSSLLNSTSTERKSSMKMKNQNIVVIAMASALVFALAPVTKANISPQGGPAVEPVATANSTSAEDMQLPVVTIHSAGNIRRGQTGSFVLQMNRSAVQLSGIFVNFKVSGTAIPGVDYVALVSPAFIGQTGFAVISVKTLPDPRAASSRQAYSVVATLEPGLGYAIGGSSATTAEPISAVIFIKP